MPATYISLIEPRSSLDLSNRSTETSANRHPNPECDQSQLGVAPLRSERNGWSGQIHDGPLPWPQCRSNKKIEILQEEKKRFVEVIEEPFGQDHASKGKRASLYSPQELTVSSGRNRVHSYPHFYSS
jgi:hypothetical protein